MQKKQSEMAMKLEEKLQDLPLRSFIEYYCHIKFNESEKLPQNVCKKCQNSIGTFAQFCVNMERIQETLEQQLKKDEVIKEIEIMEGIQKDFESLKEIENELPIIDYVNCGQQESQKHKSLIDHNYGITTTNDRPPLDPLSSNGEHCVSIQFEKLDRSFLRTVANVVRNNICCA